MVQLQKSDNYIEGLTAFTEKRKPKWTSKLWENVCLFVEINICVYGLYCLMTLFDEETYRISCWIYSEKNQLGRSSVSTADLYKLCRGSFADYTWK
jgi:hypothetical protein